MSIAWTNQPTTPVTSPRVGSLRQVQGGRVGVRRGAGGGGRGGRGGGARGGRGGGGRGAKKTPAPSLADLDAELDAYISANAK